MSASGKASCKNTPKVQKFEFGRVRIEIASAEQGLEVGAEGISEGLCDY